MRNGDTVEHALTGQRRVITRVAPAGSAGTSYADGPTFMATIADADGKPIVGGHTVAIWSRSLSYPTSDWKVVNETHAWADGFGVWHVRVLRSVANPLAAATTRLREELEAREARLAPEVWANPIRVVGLDDADSIVYSEGTPS